MAQPSTIYKPSKLNYVWNYLSSTLDNFKAALLGYRTYKAMLTQTGTDAPVATVLENSLKLNLTYEYDSVGIYYAYTDTDLFDTPTSTADGRKIEVFINPQSTLDPITNTFTISAYPVFFFVIGITIWDQNLVNYNDNILGNWCSTVLEIRVYNK
jgi:hypothetical protein